MALALVTGTGSAQGIATAIVLRLQSDGWDVVTSDRVSGDFPCDLADANAARELVDRVVADRGPLDALVLSQAHDVESSITNTSAESFDQHIAVNARASMLLISAFARQVRPAGGAVVALTSDHTTGNLPYGASKGALDRIVIAAAREFGPQRVSANVVNPGPVDTGWMDDAVRAALLARQPLGRLGTPADIAAIVAFLVSHDGRWITGQLLHADGGFSAAY